MSHDHDQTDPGHRNRPTGKNTLAVEKQKLILEQRRIELAAEDRARDDRRAMARQVIAAVIMVVALALIGAALYWGRSFSFSGLGIEAQTGHAPTPVVD
jgi:fatty acid desaturase